MSFTYSNYFEMLNRITTETIYDITIVNTSNTKKTETPYANIIQNNVVDVSCISEKNLNSISVY